MKTVELSKTRLLIKRGKDGTDMASFPIPLLAPRSSFHSFSTLVENQRQVVHKTLLLSKCKRDSAAISSARILGGPSASLKIQAAHLSASPCFNGPHVGLGLGVLERSGRQKGGIATRYALLGPLIEGVVKPNQTSSADRLAEFNRSRMRTTKV